MPATSAETAAVHRGDVCRLPRAFIECVNTDAEALEANLERKAILKEFRHLSAQEALDGFIRRIEFYERAYEPLEHEKNRILVDSFDSCILQEKIADLIPFYDRIRDIVTTRIVRNLFLLRHGETVFNVEDRIGGDSNLTEKGQSQAEAMARYFAPWRIPAIFISNHQRTQQTARPIAEKTGALLHSSPFPSSMKSMPASVKA